MKLLYMLVSVLHSKRQKATSRLLEIDRVWSQGLSWVEGIHYQDMKDTVLLQSQILFPLPVCSVELFGTQSGREVVQHIKSVIGRVTER